MPRRTRKEVSLRGIRSLVEQIAATRLTPPSGSERTCVRNYDTNSALRQRSDTGFIGSVRDRALLEGSARRKAVPFVQL